MTTSSSSSRTQAERSARTRIQLIEAAIGCLVERGYAGTTTVEICSRAGLTRGAYNHHYDSLAALLSDVLDHLAERLAEGALGGGHDPSLEGLLRRGWSVMRQLEFRAVLELWLACRNDPDLGQQLEPAVLRLSALFDPQSNPQIAARLDDQNPETVALYRLGFEATIGLALGRATSPGGAPVAHEEQVLNLLFSLARERDTVDSKDASAEGAAKGT